MPAPYFSELKFLGGASLDFIEVAVDAGLDVSNISVVVYNPDGTVRTTNALGTVDGTIAGRDVYVIDTATSATFNGLHKNGAVALVVNGTVTQFLSFNASVTATAGPANGMTSTQLGTTAGGESLETSDNGATYTVQGTPNPGTVPCFLAGTLILTDRGYRPVEKLSAGDMAMTMDRGPQRLLWTGSRSLTPKEAADPGTHPVCIPHGSLAAGTVKQDLLVSPNHRIVLRHPACALLFPEMEILAPAKALTGYRGVKTCPAALPARYYHLMFAQHEIIWANGIAAESFHPMHEGLKAFPSAMRAEIVARLRHIGCSPNTYGPTARMIAKPVEVRLLFKQAGNDPLAISHRIAATAAA